MLTVTTPSVDGRRVTQHFGSAGGTAVVLG